jgi:hypothetical protein
LFWSHQWTRQCISANHKTPVCTRYLCDPLECPM